MEHDMDCLIGDSCTLGDGGKRDARELAVELAPARHTVEVLDLRLAWQRAELG